MSHENNLYKIIKKFTNVEIPHNIYNIYDHSMDLEKNSIFVLQNPKYICINQYKNNIISHLNNKKPTVTLFIDKVEEIFITEINNNIFGISIFINNETLEKIINEYYYLQPKTIIGVTGSCGKTSTSSFIYYLLEKMQIKSLLIGTLDIKGINNNIKIRNTTPSWITLKRLLHESQKYNIKIAILEVSSHGINENRIKNINFTCGVWTHFIDDHLEYHKTIENYFICKNSFMAKLPITIVNEQVNKYNPLLQTTFQPTYIYGNKINNITEKYFTFLNNQYHNNPYMQFYQQENLIGAIITLYALGYYNVFEYMNININIPARMEFFGYTKNGAAVYNDDAYRWNNILAVLSYFKNLKRIILVIGAGGDRNRGPDYRKNIGALSVKVDKLIICDVNPRSENPLNIRNEIIGNEFYSNNIINIGNRFDALMLAFQSAHKHNIILILPNCYNNQVIYKNHYSLINDKDIFRSSLIFD